MLPLLTAGPFSARDAEGRGLFDEVSIELAEGELALLDGPSGSGKSTLLRQLVGMVATTGVVRELAGEAFSPLDLPRWRSRVTLVAQDAPMLQGSVGENLEFPFLQGCGSDRTEDRERRRTLLEKVGLGTIPEGRDIGTLSGGERHRLALVRGLMWNPPVLIADEPLSGLDEDVAEACFQLLLDFAHRSGHGVLCVLHDRSIGARADRILGLGSNMIEGPS